MKKRFGFALTVLIVAVAVPALADVTVTTVITKEKDISVTETLTKVKEVFINVLTEDLLEGAAEVSAVVNVTNRENLVDRDTRLVGFNIERFATIEDSINTNSGVLGLNQDVGNMVNQANVVSVGITESPTAFTEAQAHVDQRNLDNDVFQNELTFDPATPDRSATITGSISGNTGIVGVNQNAGNMNNQTNAVALAVGLNAIVALSEADLGQVNSGNRVEESATVKLDLIQNSISGNAGIVSVNQSSGNMNNQAAVVSFAALTSSVSISPPGGP